MGCSHNVILGRFNIEVLKNRQQFMPMIEGVKARNVDKVNESLVYIFLKKKLFVPMLRCKSDISS